MLAGCASVDKGAFTSFSTSVEALRTGSQKHTQSAVTTSRKQLIEAIAGGELSPADLQLEFTGPFDTRYGFAENEPNYIKYQRYRSGLVALNRTLAEYARLLELLAGAAGQGDTLPSYDQFAQMTRDLNANALRATASLGLPVSGNSSAILSTAAMQLFKVYLERSRQQALAAAIVEVQPQITAFSILAQQAVRVLAGQVETDYSNRFLSLAVASPTRAEPLLKLNKETRDKLAVLESMHDSYRALPGAHQELAEAAAHKPGLRSGLNTLKLEAKRLRALQVELKRSNAAASKERQVTKQ